MSENQTIAQLQAARVVGVLRSHSSQSALQSSHAALQAGLEALEITLTTPDACAIIAELVAAYPKCTIGAGTIMNCADAEAALAAGATFLVSPHLAPDVLEFAAQKHVLYIPGVITPNEVALALRLGCPVLKLFPITRVGGVAYLKDLLGPFPQLKTMVSGGVKSSEVSAYLAAGAMLVGLGDFLGGNAVAQQTEGLLAGLA